MDHKAHGARKILEIKNHNEISVNNITYKVDSLDFDINGPLNQYSNYGNHRYFISLYYNSLGEISHEISPKSYQLFQNYPNPFNQKTIINYNLSSKQLVEVRGSGVYGHLKELRQLDFIESQNVGRMKIYNTTEKFRKYFGIQGDADTLRQKLFTKVRNRNKITR